MNVTAIRDDGALLVVKDGTFESDAVLILPDGSYAITSRGAALARNEWKDADGNTEIPQNLRDAIRDIFDASSALTAATGRTGAMIALVPTAEDAERLAVDGGLDPDELHLTLGYLGRAALVPDEMRAWIIDNLSKKAIGTATVVAEVFSVNVFNPGDDNDKEPCVVLGVSGKQLDTIWAQFMGIVRDTFIMSGAEMHPQHAPWIPHITILYTDDADLSYFTDRMGPVTFDTIRVAFGDDVYDIPLGEKSDDAPSIVADAGKSDESVWDSLISFDEDGELIVPNVLIDMEAFAKEKDVNIPGGPGHNLRDYWIKGKGAAKIRWNTGGDFTRCTRLLAKYVKDSKGLCAEYHKQATGMWPGDKRNREMESGTETFDTEVLYPIDGANAETDGEIVRTPNSWPWKGVLTVEGLESGDSRMFATNSLSWDEPPLPLMWQKETSHGGRTDVSVRVGSIEKIWREPDPGGRSDVNLVMGSGTIDLGHPDGREVYRRMKNGYMRGNSVDVDSVKGSDIQFVYSESASTPVESGDDSKSVSFDMFSQPELTIYNKGRIRATTLVEIPAFTEARLELDNETVIASYSEQAMDVQNDVEDTSVIADNAPRTEREEILETIVAATSTINISDAPPREWFEEPKDVSPSGALTVTSDGRVYGWIAPAGVRHRSFRDRAQYVPRKNVDYDRFMGGQTIVADGGRISTGSITMNCGHAPTAMNINAQAASDHYDNTCSIVATVRVGENRHGTWVAGALLPDVTADQVRRMMACNLSGDWRAHLDRPGWREFVAALLVPVPGFPMARSAPTMSLSEGELVASTVPVQFVINKDDDDDDENTNDNTTDESDDAVDSDASDESDESNDSDSNNTKGKLKKKEFPGVSAHADRIAMIAQRIGRPTQMRSTVESPADRVAALRARVRKGK